MCTTWNVNLYSMNADFYWIHCQNIPLWLHCRFWVINFGTSDFVKFSPGRKSSNRSEFICCFCSFQLPKCCFVFLKPAWSHVTCSTGFHKNNKPNLIRWKVFVPSFDNAFILTVGFIHSRWTQPSSSFWLQLLWRLQSSSIQTVSSCSVYGKPSYSIVSWFQQKMSQWKGDSDANIFPSVKHLQ